MADESRRAAARGRSPRPPAFAAGARVSAVSAPASLGLPLAAGRGGSPRAPPGPRRGHDGRAASPPRSSSGSAGPGGGVGAGARAGVRGGGRDRAAHGARSGSCARDRTRRGAISASASRGAPCSRRLPRPSAGGVGRLALGGDLGDLRPSHARGARFVRPLRGGRPRPWRGCAKSSTPPGTSPGSASGGCSRRLWVLGGAVAFYLGRPTRPARRHRRRGPLRSAADSAPGRGALRRGGGGVRAAAGARPAASPANVLLPLVALYFVAGLSIICHFVRRWFRVRLLRAGLYVLVSYFPLDVVVALLGLFDWYVDFRRRGEGVVEKS